MLVVGVAGGGWVGLWLFVFGFRVSFELLSGCYVNVILCIAIYLLIYNIYILLLL